MGYLGEGKNRRFFCIKFRFVERDSDNTVGILTVYPTSTENSTSVSCPIRSYILPSSEQLGDQG